MKQHIANILTGFRIFGSILLLLFPVFSAAFYVTYILCGFSDMIDGTVARKTNSTSRFGSKLDSVADLIFLSASLVKVLPVVAVPGWLWRWGLVIALIKIGSIAWGFASKKQLISLHTSMNKATGFLLFLWPLTRSFAGWKYITIAVCFIATLAAIQEGVSVITDREPGRA